MVCVEWAPWNLWEEDPVFISLGPEFTGQWLMENRNTKGRPPPDSLSLLCAASSGTAAGSRHVGQRPRWGEPGWVGAGLTSATLLRTRADPEILLVTARRRSIANSARTASPRPPGCWRSSPSLFWVITFLGQGRALVSHRRTRAAVRGAYTSGPSDLWCLLTRPFGCAAPGADWAVR